MDQLRGKQEDSKQRQRRDDKHRSRSRSSSNSKQKYVAEVSQERKPRKVVYIADLPKRPPRVPYKQGCKEIQLTTNSFQINLLKQTKLVIYAVKFTPPIQMDNRQLKRQLLMTQEKELRKEIGDFVLSGSVIFSNSENKAFELGVQFNTIYREQIVVNYKIEVRKAKVIEMSDLENPDPKVNFLALNWFGILVKNFLRNLKFFEHGRTRKYYDPNKRSDIQETKLSVMTGYATSFQMTESGLNLKVDISHRLVRQESSLQVINQIYTENANKDKDYKRKCVRDELIGQQILANYGNYQTHVIQDVIFDKDVTEFSVEIVNFEGQNEMITLFQYFKQRYNYEIKFPKAPLLVSLQRKTQKVLHFIPEMCIMAGVPKNFNEIMRKKVSQHCIMDPGQRYQNITSMVTKMLQGDQQEVRAEHLKNVLGIEMSPYPKKIQAKVLDVPTILFGENQSSKEIFNGNFNSTKYQAFSHQLKVSYAVIHPLEFEYREFEKILIETTERYGVRMDKDIKRYKLGEQSHHHLGEIEDILKDKIQNKFSIVIIVVNNQLKRHYAKLKQLCLLKCGILSQVVQQDTMRKRGIAVICSKLTQQILNKIGNTIWTVQKPVEMPNNIMIIAILEDKSITGFCASLDQNYSKYYSQIVISQPICIDTLIENAFKAFYNQNQVYPSAIIYFREGLNDEQIENVLLNEVPLINKAASSLSPTFNDKLSIMTIQKSSLNKLFYDNNGRLQNAPAGTVVDDNIVSRNYDFLLIANHTSRGTTTPMLYRMIYDKLKLPIQMIEDFVYGQCFNYSNWSGSIRLPAIVQNCNKLVKFVSETIGKDPLVEMRTYLYFL